PVERLPLPRALHHDEVSLLHPLERRVPAAAAQALPPPAGGGAAVGHARVDDLVVHAVAVRAAHGRNGTARASSTESQTYVCTERPFVLRSVTADPRRRRLM